MVAYVLGTISCEELVNQRVLPVGVRIVGELLPEVGYARNKCFTFDLNDGSQRAKSYAPQVFNVLECQPKAVNLFEIAHARIIGQGTVILPDGRVVSNSAAEFLNHSLIPDGFVKHDSGFAVLSDAKNVELNGTSLLVKRPWYRNYGHWLVDLAPIIPLIYNSGQKVDHIIYGNINIGELRSIMIAIARRYFPVCDIVFQDDKTLITAEKLLYVQPLHVPPLFKHPYAAHITVDALENLLQPPAKAVSSRLYISRQKLSSRKVLNQERFDKVLHKYNFQTVCSEELSLRDQISLFSSAEFVIGVKGAGMTNGIFSRPGTTFLLLTPPDFTDAFFWDLLSPRGIEYGEIYCPGSPEGVGASAQDIEVPVEKVDALLSSFL